MSLLSNALAALRSWGRGTTEGPETGPKGDRRRPFEVDFARNGGRKGQWEDINGIDRDEAVVARALDIIARYSTQFTDNSGRNGFALEGPEDELAMLKPLADVLQTNAFEHVRYAVKFGDLFAETVVGTDWRIANVKMFPYCYQINVNVDQFGRLKTGDPVEAMNRNMKGLAAYDQIDEMQRLVAAFHPYQISQLSFGNKQGLPYAEPLLGPVISPCKRLRAMEDGVSIARLNRAYQTRVHYIPVSKGLNEEEVQKKVGKYRENMTRDTSMPYDENADDIVITSRQAALAVTDYFVPRLFSDDGKMVDGDVKNLQADSANLDNLEDIYLMLRRVLCGVSVPSDFLNLSVGQQSFVDKESPAKREAFLYLCQAVQIVYHQWLLGLFQLQMLLNGRMPWEMKTKVVLPRISPREAEVAAKIDLERANTAVLWRSMGIPAAITGSKVLQMTPQEVQEWVESSGAIPPEGQTAESVRHAWVEYAREALSAFEEHSNDLLAVR